MTFAGSAACVAIFPLLVTPAFEFIEIMHNAALSMWSRNRHDSDFPSWLSPAKCCHNSRTFTALHGIVKLFGTGTFC